MAKGGKRQKKDFGNPKKKITQDESFGEDDMDDEVDAFHKQRDVVPLDADGDFELSDDDNEHPVFGLENDDDDDDDDDEDEEDDEAQLTGLAAKIARQEKYMRQKFGGVDDEMHEDSEEEEDDKKVSWVGRGNLHGGDNVDYELQDSDEDLPEEEEKEVIRMQKEKAKSLSMADYGIEDSEQDESNSDAEPTLEDIGRGKLKPHVDKETEDDSGIAYEEVKKDFNALSNEEKMDVVYSSAPELVGLLSELNDAFDQLEGKVNPLLDKVKGSDTSAKGGVHYLEVKQLLLLTYCQAIGFYLLLKSEGHPVRDHPVIARLVEIKTLLDKMKQLDGNLPSEVEEFLNLNSKTESSAEMLKESDVVTSEPRSTVDGHSSDSAKTHGAASLQLHETVELLKEAISKEHNNKQVKRKHQNDQVGLQSKEMLKVRASLEEKLKQKGLLSSVAPKPDKARKHQQPLNRQLESFDDFGDEVVDKEGVARGLSNGHASSLSHLVTARVKKPKVGVSGDEDLPKRDDIGERRRKHELRVLATARVDPMDNDDDQPRVCRRAAPMDADEDNDEIDESEEEGEKEVSKNEFYEQVKQQREAKLAAKAQLYPRTSAAAPSWAEAETVDGKRPIGGQISKNRGLTRPRPKDKKNPRTNYRTKHDKSVKRRKGQVRDVKKPSGPYGGETSGINAGVSRSIRFKS